MGGFSLVSSVLPGRAVKITILSRTVLVLHEHRPRGDTSGVRTDGEPLTGEVAPLGRRGRWIADESPPRVPPSGRFIHWTSPIDWS